jgi:hypothetical protein
MYVHMCAHAHSQVLLWNTRLKVQLLAGSLVELASYGPAKPPSEQGLDNVKDVALVADGGAVPSRGPNYVADPHGNRTGEAPSAQLQDVLRKVLQFFPLD